MARNVRLKHEYVEKMAKLCRKYGLSALEIDGESIKMSFYEEKPSIKGVNYGKVSKEVQAELDYLQKEQEMDELKFMDPAAYEEKLGLEAMNG